MVDIGLFRALAPYLADPDKIPNKVMLGKVPARPLPAAILDRSKTGFAVPVRDWLNASGAQAEMRGLRGWSRLVAGI